MNDRRRVRIAVWLLGCWFAIGIAPAGADIVKIVRDDFGVPHIYGESERAVAYGLATAQCEDDLLGVVRCLHQGAGRLAEIDGARAFRSDEDARILGHAYYSRQAWPDLDPTLRAMIEAYCAGVNDYLEAHPDELGFTIDPVEPVQVLAWHRMIVASRAASISHIDARLEPDEDHPRIKPEKSNSWIVSGSKTASGHPMIHLDPHWPYPEAGATLRLYESHLHGGRLDVASFGVLGLPTVGIGVTSFAAWTMTDGGADSSDAYRLLTNPSNEDEYLFDGRWERMSIRTETVRVLQNGGGFEDRIVRVRESRHGPVYQRPSSQGVVTYAAAYSGNRRGDTIEQFYRLSIARTAEEFQAALAMNRITYWNLIWGTVEGDIGYVQFGACPKRPDEFNWERLVPGWTSRSLYRGMIPYEEMPIVVNPPSGFLQNCNNAANEVTPGLTFTAADFAPGVLYAFVGQYRSRAVRVTELLSQEKLFTLEDGRRIAFDKHVTVAEEWIPILLQAYDEVHANAKAAPSDAAPLLARTIEILRKWDLEADIGSVGATVFRAWRLVCSTHFPDSNPVGRDGRQFENTLALRRDALKALDIAGGLLVYAFGRVDVPWGDIKRLRRGSQEWPLSGGGGAALGRLGLDTLRATGASTFSSDGKLIANGGQCVSTVALLAPRPEIRTITPYGQSSDPDSPHFADQAPLYSAERLREVPWRPEEGAEFVESVSVYEVP